MTSLTPELEARIRALDTKKGPTGKGRWLALPPGEGLKSLRAWFVGDDLVWAWDDMPSQVETEWTPGWPCARQPLAA